MKTEAQKKAEKNYRAKLDTIVLRIPKEEGARIRQDAENAGMSVTAYIRSKLK